MGKPIPLEGFETLDEVKEWAKRNKMKVVSTALATGTEYQYFVYSLVEQNNPTTILEVSSIHEKRAISSLLRHLNRIRSAV